MESEKPPIQAEPNFIIGYVELISGQKVIGKIDVNVLPSGVVSIYDPVKMVEFVHPENGQIAIQFVSWLIYSKMLLVDYGMNTVAELNTNPSDNMIQRYMSFCHEVYADKIPIPENLKKGTLPLGSKMIGNKLIFESEADYENWMTLVQQDSPSKENH